MPTRIRPREAPKDTTRKGSAPPPGNGSQNLVFTVIDDAVDTTDVYTDDESD